MPLLFLMCDGRVSDLALFNRITPTVKNKHFGSIIACVVGSKTNIENIKSFTSTIVHLDTTDSATFRQFFKWVSASVSIGNRSIGATDELLLPPPPPEVHTVI